MKKVLIMGATGRTGSEVVNRLLPNEEVCMTLFVRNPAKVTVDNPRVTVVQGDMTDKDKVKEVMRGQEILISCLEGYKEMQGFAENILAGLPDSGLRRIIWQTGMGIHGEVKGISGFMLKQFAKQYPGYVKAADMIMESGAEYTLLRCGSLTEANDESYTITHEGDRINNKPVSRKAVAAIIAKMIDDENFGRNESLGVTG